MIQLLLVHHLVIIFVANLNNICINHEWIYVLFYMGKKVEYENKN